MRLWDIERERGGGVTKTDIQWLTHITDTDKTEVQWKNIQVNKQKTNWKTQKFHHQINSLWSNWVFFHNTFSLYLQVYQNQQHIDNYQRCGDSLWLTSARNSFWLGRAFRKWESWMKMSAVRPPSEQWEPGEASSVTSTTRKWVNGTWWSLPLWQPHKWVNCQLCDLWKMSEWEDGAVWGLWCGWLQYIDIHKSRQRKRERRVQTKLHT